MVKLPKLNIRIIAITSLVILISVAISLIGIKIYFDKGRSSRDTKSESTLVKKVYRGKITSLEENKINLETEKETVEIWLDKETKIVGTGKEGTKVNSPLNISDLKAGESVEVVAWKENQTLNAEIIYFNFLPIKAPTQEPSKVPFDPKDIKVPEQ